MPHRGLQFITKSIQLDALFKNIPERCIFSAYDGMYAQKNSHLPWIFMKIYNDKLSFNFNAVNLSTGELVLISGDTLCRRYNGDLVLTPVTDESA